MAKLIQVVLLADFGQTKIKLRDSLLLRVESFDHLDEIRLKRFNDNKGLNYGMGYKEPLNAPKVVAALREYSESPVGLNFFRVMKERHRDTKFFKKKNTTPSFGAY